VASLLSLPERGGGFPAAEFVGPELAAFARADAAAFEDELVAALAAAGTRSCHRAARTEYVATLRRLAQAAILEWSAEKSDRPLGMFGVWKVVGEILRLIVDAHPANASFRTPKYVNTGGDSLARMQVLPGHVLEAAKADLADFFHSCEAVENLRPLVFGRCRFRRCARRVSSYRTVRWTSVATHTLGSRRCR